MRPPTWNVWRWFGTGPALAPAASPGGGFPGGAFPGGGLPDQVADWEVLAALEQGMSPRLRCRWVTPADHAAMGEVLDALLGVALDLPATARLLAPEWEALARAMPGDAPVEPQGITLAGLLEAGAALPALVAQVRSGRPAVEASATTARVIGVGDAVVVAVVTERMNWLRRPPLPAAFYGWPEPPTLVDRIDPVDRPHGWRHHLGTLGGAPAGWRTDVWFDLLQAFGPLAVVFGLGPDDEDALTAATAGTPFADPLWLGLGEKLLVEGIAPERSRSVQALVAHLGLQGDEVDLYRDGHDWLAGALDPTRDVVRARLIDPLHRAVLRGEDPSALLGQARRLGGDRLLASLRDMFVRDGTLSAGEWDELSVRAG